MHTEVRSACRSSSFRYTVAPVSCASLAVDVSPAERHRRDPLRGPSIANCRAAFSPDRGEGEQDKHVDEACAAAVQRYGGFFGPFHDLGTASIHSSTSAGGGDGRHGRLQLPEAVHDVVRRNASWVPTPQLLSRGLGNPRARGDWYEFYVRRTETAMAEDGAMRSADGEGIASTEAIVGR